MTMLTHTLVQALGWTLVHSLWQGAAVALVFLLVSSRLHAARQRYWAAYGALMTVLAGAATTFALIVNSTVTGAAAGGVLMENNAAASPYFSQTPWVSLSFWQQASGWLEARHPALVALWLLGLGFFLLRFAGGFYGVMLLRRRATRVLDARWPQRLDELAARLGQTRPVALLESALVRVPLTLGWLKPLILLPVGLVNQLAPAEVEAILAHELAHVVRRDWLLNLLQSLVETLFYFHPAVWWLSGVARAERENCCDDLAVTLTGDRLAYAKALVRIQEMSRLAPPAPALTLAAAGAAPASRRPSPLLARIQRILDQQHKKSQLMEKFMATALLVVLAALWGLRAEVSGAPLAAALGEIVATPLTWFDDAPGRLPQLAQAAPIENDSVPKGRKTHQTQRIIQEEDGRRVEMELQDGEISRLNIDGTEVPPAEFAQHEALTEELLRSVPPAPPVPPTPPAAPMMPGLWPMPPMPPMPAMPPIPPTSRITTEKDAAGNTIIRLERPGAPTEITVKDGEVWIDGRKVEPGQPLELPPGEAPMFFWHDGQRQPVPPGEGFFFSPEGVPAPEELAEMREEQLRAMAEQQKQMEKDMARQEKEWRKQQKHWSKEQKRQMEAARQGMRRSQEDLRRSEFEMRRNLEMLRRAEVEAGRADAARNRSEGFSKAFKTELQRDGLLPDPNNYSVKLNDKELVVNGTKQSDTLHRKYLELYRAQTGKEIGPTVRINIVESNN